MTLPTDHLAALQAPIDDEMILFTCNGDSVGRQKIKDDTPKPALQAG